MSRVLISFLCLVVSSACIGNEHYQPCRIEHHPFEIECGKLSLNNPSSTERSIVLHYYKVAAKVRYPKPEPVIWIPDGLGIVATERAPFIISNLARLRNHRDLIWMDIRGTGKSNPIDCIDYTLPSMAYRLYRYSDDKFVKHCHESLKASGGIETFSYTEIARDFEALTEHLGLKQVTVYAEGQGANIALAWAKIAPDRIKFQVLDSPPISALGHNNHIYALRFEETVQQLFTHCKNTPNCVQNFPNLNVQLSTIIKQLPIKIEVNDPVTLKNTTITLTSEVFLHLIHQLLASPNRAKYLPFLIDQAAKGNWQPALGLIGLHWSKRTGQFNYGLHIANLCLGNQQTQVDDSKLSFLAQWFLATEQSRLNKLCSDVSIYPPDTDVSNNRVPTLLLTAKNDPTTAHAYPLFSKQIHVIAQGAGHGLIHYGCTKDVIYRYFKAQDLSKNVTDKVIDSACLTRIPLPNMDVIHTAKEFQP